jgi:hypothetical protein
VRKIVCKTCLALLLCSNLAQAENWTRSTIDIKEKGWSSGDGYKINAELVNYPFNLNYCDGSDKALRFNIQKLYNDANDASFDVNNIYVDGVWDGERALEVIQADNLRHHNGWQFRYLWKEDGNGTDWTQYNGYVYACVGSLVQLGTSNHELRNIILWYKNPDKTTFRNIPAGNICNASGSNWLQKIFGSAQANLVNTFCQNADNKARITFDTQNNTATINSNVPLKSNGAKSITIPFPQAGVSSAQVKAGIGQGYGGNASGIVNGTGAGYDPDPNGDTWSGYAHHVGLKYMKVGKKSSGNWDGSRTWPIDVIPNRRDFRIKLKKKGGVWPDSCAEVWFSHNKDFTDDDWHLKTECKNLSDSQYDDDDYKSIYVKDVYIPNEMEAGKNYYFFTRITYSGGVNPSSRDDNDEYVKVEIVDFSSEFEMDTVIGEVPLGVFFTNKSKLIKNDGVSGSISYYWDFGDGSTSNEENPVHLYEEPGTYTAALTTTASWGEVKTSQSKVVTVLEEEGLSVAQKMDILW